MDESLFLRRNLMQGEKVPYIAKIHFMYDVKAAFIGLIGIGLGLGFSSFLKVSGLFPVEYGNVPLYVFDGIKKGGNHAIGVTAAGGG